MSKFIPRSFINVPVADLRREPCPLKKKGEKDPMQESQLLFGEGIEVLREENGWAQVACPEQQRFSAKEGWHGYHGWIQSTQVIENEKFKLNDLVIYAQWAAVYQNPDEKSSRLQTIPLGSYLEQIGAENEWLKIRLPNNQIGYIKESHVQSLSSMKKWNHLELRRRLIAAGRTFLDTPYLWGGRSFYNVHDEILTGVDCSGLVNLLYRMHGIFVPRDAHDQFLKSQPKNSKDLEIGDLVFTSSIEKQSRISHVMLVAGNDFLLESAMQPNCVREISGSEQFGRPLLSLEQGEQIGDSLVWFGALI